MSVKRGYKQTDVGVIPEEWEVASLGTLVHSVDYGSAAASKPNGRVPVLRMGNLQGGGLDWKDLVYTDNLAEIRKYELRRGDVLFNRTNTIELVGKTSIYMGERPAIFAGYLIRIVVDSSKLDSMYLNYTMNTALARRYSAKVLSVAVGQANINGQKLKTYPIPLPPSLSEQRAIAVALSDVDALIASLDRLIAKKRDLKQAAMQQLLTGQTRLPGFGGKWEAKRLGDICALKSGFSFRSETYTSLGEYRVITIANVQDGYMDAVGCNKIAYLPDDLQAHQKLSRGDILISMTGNVGRVCRVSEDACVLNQRVGKLIPGNVDEAFLFSLLRQRTFLSAMGEKAKGGAQGNLSISDIQNHPVCIPSDDPEQSAIASVLSDMDAELTALEQRRDKTKLLKQGMMQELLTGRTRLV